MCAPLNDYYVCVRLCQSLNEYYICVRVMTRPKTKYVHLRLFIELSLERTLFIILFATLQRSRLTGRCHVYNSVRTHFRYITSNTLRVSTANTAHTILSTKTMHSYCTRTFATSIISCSTIDIRFVSVSNVVLTAHATILHTFVRETLKVVLALFPHCTCVRTR